MQILSLMCHWSGKYTLNFRSHPDLECGSECRIGTQDLDQTDLGGSIHSLTALVLNLKCYFIASVIKVMFYFVIVQLDLRCHSEVYTF